MELSLQITTALIMMAGFAYVLHKQREMHNAMNSRLDALLKSTGDLARSEGFAAGQKDPLGSLKDATSTLEKK
jgi:hypothetical protein